MLEIKRTVLNAILVGSMLLPTIASAGYLWGD